MKVMLTTCLKKYYFRALQEHQASGEPEVRAALPQSRSTLIGGDDDYSPPVAPRASRSLDEEDEVRSAASRPWQCRSCTLHNESRTARCVGCNRPNPAIDEAAARVAQRQQLADDAAMRNAGDGNQAGFGLGRGLRFFGGGDQDEFDADGLKPDQYKCPACGTVQSNQLAWCKNLACKAQNFNRPAPPMCIVC
jgi:hypothetical protein